MRRTIDIRKANKLLTLIAALMLLDRATAQAVQNQSESQQAPASIVKKVERRIVISIPDRKMAVIEDGETVKVYRVAVGKESTPSPAGEYTIQNRLVDPTYYHKGTVIGPGADNPLGNRWMGLNAKGYGIHGTNEPGSIGKAASHGCIRMAKKDLEELFKRLAVGDEVQIRSERDDEIALLFPDVKVKDKTTLAVAANRPVTSRGLITAFVDNDQY